MSQKLCFCKRDGRAWVARKKFLLGTMVTNNTSLASVGLYLSTKANGIITLRLKRILRSQTSAGSDFLNLVLFVSHISSRVIQFAPKIVFLQTWWSNLSGAKKILLGTMVTNDTSLALVWSYLSAKANGMITRRLKRILRSQTSAGGDFLNLVLSEFVISISNLIFMDTLQKWRFHQNITRTLSANKKFLRGRTA